MPRTNYVVAWNDLKDLLGKVQDAHIPAISPSTVLNLMFTIEHNPVDWTNLYEILQYLKAPEDHR